MTLRHGSGTKKKEGAFTGCNRTIPGRSACIRVYKPISVSVRIRLPQSGPTHAFHVWSVAATDTTDVCVNETYLTAADLPLILLMWRIG